jgi:hypothetical protein
MFTATFFFLGLAVCMLGGLVCYALARSLKATNTAHAIQPSPDERAAWERLKKALAELHSRYEGAETTKEKTLRSWVGTLVICAGLCMIGILMEARYDDMISAKSIVTGFVGKQHVTDQLPQQNASPAVQHNTSKQPKRS